MLLRSEDRRKTGEMQTCRRVIQHIQTAEKALASVVRLCEKTQVQTTLSEGRKEGIKMIND